jgi:hypothetical protein
MHKRELIALLVLLYFPVFAQAGTLGTHNGRHNSGEFALPTGVFNFQLGVGSSDFTTKQMFPEEKTFKSDSGEFKTSGFGIDSGEFKSSGGFGGGQGEFSSSGIMSGDDSGEFQSSSQGDFKFSLPKDKN